MHYKPINSALYLRDRQTYLHYQCINNFVSALQTRMPFEVTFPGLNLVDITFCHGGHSHLLQLQLGEFEALMSYAFMHIDDIF